MRYNHSTSKSVYMAMVPFLSTTPRGHCRITNKGIILLFLTFSATVYKEWRSVSVVTNFQIQLNWVITVKMHFIKMSRASFHHTCFTELRLHSCYFTAELFKTFQEKKIMLVAHSSQTAIKTGYFFFFTTEVCDSRQCYCESFFTTPTL